MKFLLLLLFSITNVSALVRQNDDNLTLKLAQERRAQVKDVEYFLRFELEKGADTFRGVVRLELTLNSIKKDLSIDFLALEIETLKVNGTALRQYPKRRGSFDVPAKYLSPKTSVEVTYTGTYSKEASGFQRSKDPEDGSEYLFTDFEPYYAHRLFPCLDQPDLKAVYHLSVSAPSEWKIIHNELIEKEERGGEKTLTVFRATKPFSTYLFFLGAGPYVEWKASHGDLPLYIYARKSLAKYVDHEAIMTTTKKGLSFFNDYFGYSHPFSKYAHVFIPEFAWGGMENPGAVAMNERNIFRGPVPQSRYERRDSLILHEMAHMWFGDLVTMEWWNDLWLNESFASYLAAVAQERAMDSKATWLDFFFSKTWGYWQDQLVSTHPIETDVLDVRSARANFDGITYAKGAASLKQLHYFVGEEGFKNGLRDYFKRYAFSNTKREDFIGAIAKASQTDLTDWTAKWLKTAGPNRVTLVPQCDQGKLVNLTVKQRPSVSGTLSPHRALVGFYQDEDGKLSLKGEAAVLYSSESTEVKVEGRNCPDFILPNLNDFDYALYALDERSLEKAKTALSQLPDPLSRLMVWGMLYQMTRDAELNPMVFIENAFGALKTETDDLLLGSLLSRYSHIKNVYELYLGPKERALIAPQFEALLWDRVEQARPGISLQMSFYDFFVTVSQSGPSVSRLYDILTKNAPPKGITLDQDRRWAILMNLSTNGHLEAMNLITAELKRDPSTFGKRMALAAQAAYPTKSNKEQMWKTILTNKDLTHSELEEIGARMHGVNHPELSESFLKAYFKRLTTVNWQEHDDKVDVYFEGLFPHRLCTEDLLKMSQRSLRSAKNLTSTARRSWMEAQDELTRCVKVRRLLSSKSNAQKQPN